MKQNAAKTTFSYSTHLLRHLSFAIGQNIHRYRSQQRLPLKKLAKLTGISEPLLDQYELGKDEIRLDTLLKIACALRMPVAELMQA